MIKKFGARLGTMLSFGMISLFVVSGTAFADTPVVHDKATLQTLMCNIISWMIWILLAVAIIMIVMAAFEYVLAGDDTEKTTKARKTLTYAAVGIAVVLLAYGFPAIVASVFPNNPTVSSFTCSSTSS
jgi:heme/copper-type cytochrome/quinol oxidase subunit 2